MYVTRPFSTLSFHPPDAITDEDAEAHDTSCWGLCKRRKMLKLPSPQDKILTIVYTSEFVPALEQWWEEIYSCGKVNHEGNVVNVSVDVQAKGSGSGIAVQAVKDDMNGRTGFNWFKAHNVYSKKVVSVGLSSAIVENMRWVLEAGGWISGGDEKMSEKADKITSANGWRKFGCNVLVGSFPLRRMDGTRFYVNARKVGGSSHVFSLLFV